MDISGIPVLIAVAAVALLVVVIVVVVVVVVAVVVVVEVIAMGITSGMFSRSSGCETRRVANEYGHAKESVHLQKAF